MSDSAFQTQRMPAPVRAAQLLALAMAALGIACTASAGWLLGSRLALITALGFVPSWLLGLLALAFGAVGESIRVGAVLLSGLNMLWTVPAITAGHPPGWLGPAASVIVIVLLFRPSARRWFEPGW
ncbi:hypothetical protein NDR87_25425 [Nocardia sp. CDC159]|uniref:Uncharacterized protein n=1 Tax=Nocardia pulmonis TaxID=2951408 RepID=A0A9X2E6Z0_9NOCA|nr:MULTISPECIES: hypothetical protein [Nocardia]MCM6774785.1 hypothetical protein [Nocardia pulmonis]MCM6789716.1 hypothetical protein [Nocardia sp. CDC159]